MYLINLKLPKVNKFIKETNMSVTTETLYTSSVYIAPTDEDYYTTPGGVPTPQVPDPDGYTWSPGLVKWIRTDVFNKIQELLGGQYEISPVISTEELPGNIVKSVRAWPDQATADAWIAFCNSENITVNIVS